MPWVYLLLAGLMELIWAYLIKTSDGLARPWAVAGAGVAIVASFGFFGLAARGLALGTAYAVWAGLGAAGTAALGIVVFGEPAEPLRLLCLAAIVAGVVGLKLVSPA